MKHLLKKIKFYFTTGGYYADDSLFDENAVYREEACLQYKDIYILISKNDADVYSVLWQRDIPESFPVRDIRRVDL